MSFQTTAQTAWFTGGALEKGTLIRFSTGGTQEEKRIGVVKYHTKRELRVVCIDDACTYTLNAREVSLLVLTTINELNQACRLLCVNMAAQHGSNAGWVTDAYLDKDDVWLVLDSPTSVIPLAVALSDVEILNFEEALRLLPRDR